MGRTLSVSLFALVLTLVLATGTSCISETSKETTEDTVATTVLQQTEAPTEDATEPSTESITEATTEKDTEETTECPDEETETHRPTRDDWSRNDPENPYYNLIQVGTSYDGKTPCYDGRYDFGYTVCHTEDGREFSCVQDAIDWIDGIGGNIYMDAATNVCLKVDIPQDGAFYRIAYWWLNCDFVMDYGVIYDDQREKDGIVGYAYYSDLYQLDIIRGLENTYVWIVKETDGLAPGYYKMLPGTWDSQWNYTYDMVAALDQWPGLPNGELLPDDQAAI